MRALTLTCICALVALALLAPTVLSEEGVSRAEEPKPRALVQLRRLFDFENFKRIFNKSYRSLTEQTVRCKLYLANAFKVFISSVGFKHRLRSSYLAVNHLSDRTPSEISKMYPRREEVRRQMSALAGNPPPVAQMSEVERTLDELASKRPANELEAAVQEVLTGANRPSIADLVHEPPQVSREPEQVVAKVMQQPPSNNPDYVAPDLTSYGPAGGRERPEEPLAAEEESLLAGLSGMSFLGSALSGAASLAKEKLLGGPQEDRVFVDHRKSNCFFLPRNQLECGCCYIFNTIALFEWQLCVESGRLVAFSEQYALDCGARAKKPLKGCNGGREFLVVDYVKEFGLELRRKYPYLGAQEECPYAPDTPADHMGYFRVDQIWWRVVPWAELERTLETVPVSVGLSVGPDFSQYGGGIDSGADCRKEGSGGHGMVLVGDGRQEGQEYWLFRNSHSPVWGEAGHFRLAKTADCFLDDFGLQLTGHLSLGRLNPAHDPTGLVEREARRLQADQERRAREEATTQNTLSGLMDFVNE